MSVGLLLYSLIRVVTLLIIARAIGSFFVKDWSRGIPRFLFDVTEPVLSPVRRILPPLGGFDFSPLVVVVLLGIVGNYVVGL